MCFNFQIPFFLENTLETREHTYKNLYINFAIKSNYGKKGKQSFRIFFE